MSLDRFADKIREYLSPATTFSLRYYRSQLKSLESRLRGQKQPAKKRSFADNHRPRVAVFDDLIPRPDRDAGSARMMFILEALTTWADPVLFTVGRVSWPDYEELLWRKGIETLSALDYKQLQEPNFSCAILSRPWVASALHQRIRSANPKLKLIYDLVDVHHVRLEREAELTGDPALTQESKRMRRIEIENARAVDYLWCVSRADQKLMEREAPGVPSILVPTIHDLHQRGLPFSQRKHLLFVGQFSHRPNVDSVHFLARDVMPLLREQIPEIELLVVGSNAPADFEQYRSVGVRVVGYVESLDPLMASCRVSVAPIRFGAGINGKIGEALSFGLPVVTTALGAEGWGFETGKQVMVADAPEDFANEVLRMYSQETLWQQLSDAGYLHIKENNTPEVVGRIVNDSIANLTRH